MNTAVQARPPGNRQQPVTAGFHTESAHKKLAIWLDALIEESKKRPVSQIVKLTPDLAEVLLNRNPANRKVSEATVQNYAHEIAGGRWAFNGEPIIVADSGELNDGQHRCRAVMEAQRPIDVVLIVGIKRETRTTLDQGKTRTVGDYLSMRGNADANTLGAAANLIWQYRSKGTIGLGGHGSATKGEVLEIVEANPGIIQSVAYVNMKGVHAVGGRTVLAAAHFIFRATGRRDDADNFIYRIINGAGLKVGDPTLYARNRLINERGKARSLEKIELLFRAWNAERRGERVTRLWLTGTLPALEA